MEKIVPMSESKRQRLEAAGYHFGDYAEFSGMTPAEKEVTEIKLALCRLLITKRKSRRLSQSELASIMGFSQPRIAKIESFHPSVGLDATLGALLAAGATRQEIAQAIAEPQTVAETV